MLDAFYYALTIWRGPDVKDPWLPGDVPDRRRLFGDAMTSVLINLIWQEANDSPVAPVREEMYNIVRAVTPLLRTHPDRAYEMPDIGLLYAQLDERRRLEHAGQVRYIETETGESSGVPLVWRDAVINSPLDKAWIDQAALLLGQTCRFERMFRTERGRLGTGLRPLQVGDQVWLLAGYIMPIVLRPRSDGRMTFVGECYVHGMMFGEQWDEDEEHVVDVVLI